MILGGRYCAAGELSIEGDAEALLDLADALAGAKGAFAEIALRATLPSPAPYDAFLVRLRFKIHASGGVHVTRIGDILHVKGSSPSMLAFAEEIRGLAKKDEAGRVMVEPRPEGYCDERSMPLVVTLRKA